MKSDGRRVARAEREVQAAVADLLLRYFQTELGALVSVSRVQMPPDLRSAKVYVSAFDVTKEKEEEIIEFLQDEAPEFQHHLAKRISMKFCPRLTFMLDESTHKVLKIEKILDDLSKNKKPTVEEED